ncbi:MAG: hypothetical protein NWQ08_06205, partial [Porticoccaceae bacterium]|nr:hypothetical protein [Porticoccaceae bacterium]
MFDAESLVQRSRYADHN